MKRLLVLLTVAISVSSCARLNNLVEEGRYDEAIHLATKKMKGDKHKKTKHVLALEEAFNKLNDKSLRDAKYLESQGNPANWDRIHSIYFAMRARQDKITPFLPLESKDGYVATFNFVKVDGLITQAAKAASAYHYDMALALLEKAERGDKNAARKALSELNDIRPYYSNYKNASDLRDKAVYLGKQRILVRLENASNIIVPREFEREVLAISVSDMNNDFREFYLNDRDNIDVLATLSIRHIDISPERERYDHREETKEIKDGWEYVLDKNGNVMKDTLGNDIKQDRYLIVRAFVDELRREKLARVQGQITYVDRYSNEVIRTRPVSVEAIFEDYSVRFDGDRRALCDRSISRIKSHPLPFPNDFEMTMLAANEVKSTLKGDLSRTFN